MHIKWCQFLREIDAPSIAEFALWCLVDKEAGMLFQNSGQEAADPDTIAAHDDGYTTAIFIQDMGIHAV